MNFVNKAELIYFIKEQCGVELKDEDSFCNGYSRLLYTEISREHQNEIFAVLDKNGIRHEAHHNGWYWLFLINERTENDEN